MKIRTGIKEILRGMNTNIAILLGFMAYNAGKGNWTGVWILAGALVFMILAVWIGVNALKEWNEKRR